MISKIQFCYSIFATYDLFCSVVICRIKYDKLPFVNINEEHLLQLIVRFVLLDMNTKYKMSLQYFNCRLQQQLELYTLNNSNLCLKCSSAKQSLKALVIKAKREIRGLKSLEALKVYLISFKCLKMDSHFSYYSLAFLNEFCKVVGRKSKRSLSFKKLKSFFLSKKTISFIGDHFRKLHLEKGLMKLDLPLF